jgi:hypothetical protein
VLGGRSSLLQHGIAGHVRMRLRSEVGRRTAREGITRWYATIACLVGHHLPVGLHELAQSILKMICRWVP